MSNTFISRIANYKQYNPDNQTIVWEDDDLARWAKGAVYDKLLKNLDNHNTNNPYYAIFLGDNGFVYIGIINEILEKKSITIINVERQTCSNDNFLRIHALFPELISRVKANFQPFIHISDLDIDVIKNSIINGVFVNYYVFNQNNIEGIVLKPNDRIVKINNDGLISNVQMFNGEKLVDFYDGNSIEISVKGLKLNDVLQKNEKSKKRNNIKCIKDIIERITNNNYYLFNSFSAYHNAFFNNKLYNKKNNKPKDNSEQYQNNLSIFNPVNLILYGPPGTGKTYSTIAKSLLLIEESTGCTNFTQTLNKFNEKVKDGQILFTTFHQSYGYEEFIEGLKPDLNNITKNGEIKYKIEDGIFKQLCKKARENTDKNFVIIIDEINRGNISKIFGELITLIEIDKREGADIALSVKLPYSKESFSVPGNVNILGTMNTADRSLALLDTALRRRFNFEALMPDARDVIGAPLHNLRVYKEDYKEDLEINIPKLLEKINQRIEALYDRDHCIGHAYFTPLKITNQDGESGDFDDLADIFRNKIFPLLEEYFFQNWKKIRLVLGDNNKPNTDHQFILETANLNANLDDLFGENHGLETHDVKPQFSINEDAFSNPNAYIGIYS